jgi:DNA-binding response OmpR family regulator
VAVRFRERSALACSLSMTSRGWRRWSRALRHAGFTPTVVHDGESALLRVRAERFDALLTDLRLPGLSGDELALRVREEQTQLPVLLMTAAENPTVDTVAWATVLRKPFAIPELIAAVEEALAVAPL